MVRPLDAGWLWLESESNLMHGSVLGLFTPPADGGADFVDRLIERMRRCTVPSAPFDRRLKSGWRRRLLPQWEIVDEIDPSYHLRRVTLSRPGGQRELGQVVSGLHGAVLDHSQPPWTVHVIDGLEDGRFAVLGRMHHALADGVAALRIVGLWLSEASEQRDVPPIWAFQRSPRRAAEEPPKRTAARAALAGLGATLRSVPAGLGATRHALTGVSARPWSAPRSALNRPITARRRVSTRSYDFTGGTINDVVLAVCAGALRRYLDEIGELPNSPLVTNIPVSIRSNDSDSDVGNAIS
jgi:WS/DGAT/MGAT family acyltransferase